MNEETQKISVNNSKLNNIFQKSAITFFIKLAGLAAGFAFTFFVIRYYGTENFGLFSITVNIIQFVVLIAVFGCDNTLLKVTAIQQKSGNHFNAWATYIQMVKVLLVPVIFFSCLLFFFSEWLADRIFNNHGLVLYFQLSSLIIFPNTLLLIQASGLRGLNKTGWFAFFRETSRFIIALPILGIMVFLFSGNSTGAIISYLISVFIASSWSFWIWSRQIGGENKINPPEKIQKKREIYTIAVPFFMVSVFGQLSPMLNTLFLGISGTAMDVGVFNVALKIAGLLSLPLLAVNMATANSFAEMNNKNSGDLLKKTAVKTTRLIFWTSLPLLICCLLAPDWMMGLFGIKTGLGSSALIIISLAQFVNAITGSVGVIMQMSGYENIWLRILFSTTILNIICLYFFVPLFGINGAAISFMLVMILNNIAGAAYLKRKLNIRTYYFPLISR